MAARLLTSQMRETYEAALNQVFFGTFRIPELPEEQLIEFQSHPPQAATMKAVAPSLERFFQTHTDLSY